MHAFLLIISKVTIEADGFCRVLWIFKSHGFESFLV